MRTSGWTPAATIPGPECLVLNLNSAAERILRAEDGLYHRHAVSPRRARIPAMNSVARCTVHGSTAPSVPSGHAFICKRPSGKRPYVVHVQPLSRAESDETFMGPTALVLIIDPEHQNEPATTVLRRLYRLTATETEVALRISRGKSLVQIADELSMSYQTIRTHLQHVFDKTDIHHQGELVRLLLADRA